MGRERFIQLRLRAKARELIVCRRRYDMVRCPEGVRLISPRKLGAEGLQGAPDAAPVVPAPAGSRPTRAPRAGPRPPGARRPAPQGPDASDTRRAAPRPSRSAAIARKLPMPGPMRIGLPSAAASTGVWPSVCGARLLPTKTTSASWVSGAQLPGRVRDRDVDRRRGRPARAQVEGEARGPEEPLDLAPALGVPGDDEERARAPRRAGATGAPRPGPPPRRARWTSRGAPARPPAGRARARSAARCRLVRAAQSRRPA